MQRLLIPAVFSLVIFPIGSAQAKPRLVDLREELASASVVAEVKVLQYMDDRLWVQSVRDPSVRAEVRYSTDPLWNPKRFVEEGSENKKERTAVWPSLGSTVVLVLDEFGVVSLFGQLQLEGYRFWSPQVTASVALFACAPPAKIVQPVPGEGAYYRNKSWDGCLLPETDLKWKDLKSVP